MKDISSQETFEIKKHVSDFAFSGVDVSLQVDFERQRHDGGTLMKLRVAPIAFFAPVLYTLFIVRRLFQSLIGRCQKNSSRKNSQPIHIPSLRDGYIEMLRNEARSALTTTFSHTSARCFLSFLMSREKECFSQQLIPYVIAVVELLSRGRQWYECKLLEPIKTFLRVRSMRMLPFSTLYSTCTSDSSLKEIWIHGRRNLFFI